MFLTEHLNLFSVILAVYHCIWLLGPSRSSFHFLGAFLILDHSYTGQLSGNDSEPAQLLQAKPGRQLQAMGPPRVILGHIHVPACTMVWALGVHLGTVGTTSTRATRPAWAVWGEGLGDLFFLFLGLRVALTSMPGLGSWSLRLGCNPTQATLSL